MPQTRPFRPFLRALPLLLLLPLAAVPPAAAEPSPLMGHWEGAIEIPGSPLQILTDFSQKGDGTLTGTITIPAQMAKNLPLAAIKVYQGQAAFEIEGVPGKPAFMGRFSPDGRSLSGDFSQSGQTFPFSLALGASPAESDKGTLEGFDAVVEKALKDFEVPGLAIAIVRESEVIYAKGFGYRDVEKKLPVTPDTLFAIGSCTKAFTALLLGTLVDEGTLAWDEPVRHYIPEFRLKDPSASERITVRDLLCHRSGLPRHDLVWYNHQGLGRKELVARLAHLEPSADLREKFQYNNLMFLTAGYLVERVTCKTWEQAIRQRILEPLGMKRSNFDVTESQGDPDFAQPYETRDEKVVKVPFRPIGNMGPAGSINSSAGEMARWVTAQLGGGRCGEGRIASASAVEETHLAQMTTGETATLPEFTPGDYGLGWGVDTYRGHRRVSHGGGIDGFISQVVLYPQDGLGIVVLTNSSSSDLASLVERTAADRLLKAAPKDWLGESLGKKALAQSAMKEAKQKKASVRRSGTSPAHRLDEYAGEYEHPGYGVLKVSGEGGKLIVAYNGIATPLEHWHFDTFTGAKGADPVFEDQKYTFRTDANGNVASVASAFEPAVDDIVFRKKPDARLSDASYLQRFVGRYELPGQMVTIGLKGSALTVLVPGQPLYDLLPDLGGQFVLKQAKIISLRFVEAAGGGVESVEFLQPEGVFTARRVK